MVLVPPKKSCNRCFALTEDWVEVGPQGDLGTYTVVRYAEPELQPYPAPYVLGIMKLDGADSGILHVVSEISPEEVHIGMRVEAVFSAEPQGSIMDIKYFRPVK